MTHLVLKKKGDKWVIYDKNKKTIRESSKDKEELATKMEMIDEKEDKKMEKENGSDEKSYCPYCGHKL